MLVCPSENKYHQAFMLIFQHRLMNYDVKALFREESF